MRNYRINNTTGLIFILAIFYNTVCLSENITMQVIPHHDDWIYDIGQEVVFNVSVSGNIPLPFFVSYEIGHEKMAPLIVDSFNSESKEFSINGGTMDVPGFMRCVITICYDENTFTEIATAAFQPEKIIPTIKYPDDFLTFWKTVTEEARRIPLDEHFVLIEEKSSETYNVYEVSYLNYEYKNRSYGILTVPVKEGEYPAIIRFPGAGVHPYGGNLAIADKNIITLDLYIHPFPMQWERKFYDSLKDSPYIDYKFWGSGNRDTYYYKRVITGCLKAVDLVYSLQKFDGENLAVWGSSQGGALSIITASLDNRIKKLVALCPAMCDHTGYLYGRAGGWPHFFGAENIGKYNKTEVLNTLPYYDVVNFARNITVPGFYSWGFNDETTPPTSFYSAYNVIEAPKKVLIIPEGKHRIYTEQTERTYQWILN